MKENCKGLVGAIFGHRFEARYDLGSPTLSSYKSISAYGFEDVLEASKPRTYVKDVCGRCGLTVGRSKQ